MERTKREIKFRVLNALNNMVYFSILHSGIEDATTRSGSNQITRVESGSPKDGQRLLRESLGA